MADPRHVSVVIPAFNEAEAIGRVLERLLAAASWHEVLVIDDGSTDGTAAAASAAGARVVRHPYNKGNGASVKSGIRAATGDYILILDADGQHQPADALRLVARLGEYDLVVLDEVTYPITYGWLAVDEVVQTLRDRPANVDIIMTGRDADPALIEFADTVTEMTLIKHHYNAGVPAQRGIED